eukprot:3515656-Rhodomonas_salina.2
MFEILTACALYSNRATGECGHIEPIKTMSNKEVSAGVCVRGIGGPCTYIATSKGVSDAIDGVGSASSTCSSWDESMC